MIFLYLPLTFLAVHLVATQSSCELALNDCHNQSHSSYLCNYQSCLWNASQVNCTQSLMIPSAVLSSLETTCANAVQRGSLLNNVAATGQTQLDAMNQLMTTICSTSNAMLQKVQQCLDALPCRRVVGVSNSTNSIGWVSSPDEFCTATCVAQSAICFLDYWCDGGVSLVPTVESLLNEGKCAAMLPAEYSVCGGRSTPQQWCSSVVGIVADINASRSNLLLYAFIGGGAGGFLVVAAAVSICLWRWARKETALSSSLQSSPEPNDCQPSEMSLHVSNSTVAAHADVVPFSNDSPEVNKALFTPQKKAASLSIGDTEQRSTERRSRSTFSPGLNEVFQRVHRHNNHMSVDHEWMGYEEEDESQWFDPPTVVDSRPNAVKAYNSDMKWSEDGRWTKPVSSIEGSPQRPMSSQANAPLANDPEVGSHSPRLLAHYESAALFETDPPQLTTRPPLAPMLPSDSTVPSDVARDELDGPVYRGSNNLRPALNSGGVKSQGSMSLGDLEFNFTEQGSSVKPPSQQSGSKNSSSGPFREDEVVPMDNTTDESSHYGGAQTPLSDADNRSQLSEGFEQESLHSSQIQNVQKDAYISATLSRKEIMSHIVEGHFVRGRLLGRGTSGTVYQMYLTNTNMCVAMKEIDVQRTSRDELSRVIAKYNFLCRLNHRHIVALYIVRYDSTSMSLNIWMEYVGGGTLREHAKHFKRYDMIEESSEPGAAGGQGIPPPPKSFSNRMRQQSWTMSDLGVSQTSLSISHHSMVDDDFPERSAIRYINQLLSAVSYLHKKGIVHRDIKGANLVLTNDKRHVKLIDFDCCSIEEMSTPVNNVPSVAGSPLWMPPEILASKERASCATDVWSIGITVAELLGGGSLPWPKFETMFAAMVCISGGVQRPMMQRINVSASCKDFVEKCWLADSAQRPSAMELRSHSWLQGSRPSSFRKAASRSTTPSRLSMPSGGDSDGGVAEEIYGDDENIDDYVDSPIAERGEGGNAPTLIDRQTLLQRKFMSSMEEEMQRIERELDDY